MTEHERSRLLHQTLAELDLIECVILRLVVEGEPKAAGLFKRASTQRARLTREMP